MRLLSLAALLLLSALGYPQGIPRRGRIADESVATLRVAGYPDFLATEGKDVWITNEDRVEKLTMNSAKPVVTVSIPSPCGAMIVAFDSLWVASCSEKSIYRVNTKSGEILARIATGLAEPHGELSIAAGAGSIWLLTHESGVLSRIDPRSDKVIRKIDVKPDSYAATFGFGRVWITNTGPEDGSEPGTVQCIDPLENRAIATIKAGPKPRFLAAGAGAVWVLNQGDGTVTRIDPQSLKVVATVPTDIIGPGGDIDAGLDRVWVRGTKILLEVIDSRSNQLTSRFDPPAGSGAVRVAGDLLWVSAHDVNTVWVLRPQNDN